MEKERLMIMSDENIKGDSMNPGNDDDDSKNEESFASLLEKSFEIPGRLEKGQKVKSRVVSIAGDLVYIDLGGKSEGVIDVSEFSDEKGNICVQEGAEIEAIFVSVQDGLKKLTTLINGYPIADLNTIKEAYSSGIPVSGKVEREIKGGFAVNVNSVKCFCPFSQLDLRPVRRSDEHINQMYSFRILEFKDEGRNIILSRRALLEEERQAQIEKLRKDLSEGMNITARVQSIQKFGVFVDLGGIDGLIPTSELSWTRMARAEDVVAVGQEVNVKIISLDWDNERLTLSIKATYPDPWLTVADRYPAGSKIHGTIVRLVPFGAFVNLESGVDGLMHISNLGTGRRIKHPKEVVEVGQSVEAYVLSVDIDQRKISLSMNPKPEPKKIELPEVGDIVNGTVQNVMPYGIFLKIDENLSGLIPNAEMGTPQGSDHKKMFPAGSTLKAVVAEVDAANGKIRLSRKQVISKEEREQFQKYLDSVNKENESSDDVGSLGKLLRKKMDEKK